MNHDNQRLQIAFNLAAGAFGGTLATMLIGPFISLFYRPQINRAGKEFCQHVIASNCTVDQRYEYTGDEFSDSPVFPTCNSAQGSTLCDIGQQYTWLHAATHDLNNMVRNTFFGLLAVLVPLGMLAGFALYQRSQTAEMRRMASTTDTGTRLLADSDSQTSLSPHIVSLFNPTQAASNRGAPLMKGHPQDYATLTHH
jgi:hypothetical protein